MLRLSYYGILNVALPDTSPREIVIVNESQLIQLPTAPLDESLNQLKLAVFVNVPLKAVSETVPRIVSVYEPSVLF